jgi:4,5-dihydroxyphthalate decarboxylase
MGENLWPYGTEANRKTLEACLRYHREQGLLKQSYEIDQLFAPETLR